MGVALRSLSVVALLLLHIRITAALTNSFSLNGNAQPNTQLRTHPQIDTHNRWLLETAQLLSRKLMAGIPLTTREKNRWS